MRLPLHQPTASCAIFLIAISLALFAPSTLVAGPDIDIDTDVRPDTVGAGDNFRYEIHVRVEGNFRIEMTKRPSLDDMEIRGRSSSPSFAVRNGNATRSVTIEYHLQAPDEPGTYDLGAATFSIGDQSVTGEAPTLEVVEDERRPISDGETDRSDQRAFVRASISPDRNPYVGEQIGVTFELFIREDQRNLRARPPGDPSLDDFWVVDLGDDVSGRRTRQRHHGRFWYVTPLDASALFAFRPGPTTIDSIEVPLVQASLFSQRQQKVVESDPVELDIRPLPDGAPEGFSPGNVGDFEFGVDVDSKTARAGGALTVTATIDGPVRPDQIGEPVFDVPDNFRHLSTTDETTRRVVDNRLRGTRSFEYRLMPLEEGRLRIPSLTFSHFDPDIEEYVTTRSDPMEVEVEPGDVPPEIIDDAAVSRRGDTDRFGDLHGLETPGEESRSEDRPYFPLSPWLVLLPLAGLILLFLERPVVRPLMRRLSPRLRRRHLRRQADQILSGGDDPAPSRCLRALQYILTEGLDIHIGALTKVDVEDGLNKLDEMSSELAADTSALVDELVNRRYAPETDEDGEVSLETTRSIIARLLEWHFCSRTDGNSPPPGSSTAAISSIVFLCVALVAVPTAVADASDAFDHHSAPMTADEDRSWSEVATYWAQRAAEESDPLLDYNAGTAFAHAGDIGSARLHLERAVAGGASDDRVRDNLADVTASVGAENGSVAAFSRQQSWALHLHAIGPWIVVISLWVMLLVGVVRRITGYPRSRPKFISIIVAGLLVATVAAGAWHQIDSYYDDAKLAVVIDSDRMLLRAPSSDASPATGAAVSAGAIVDIVDTRNGWLLVELPSSSSGWVQADGVGEVSP